MILTTSSCGIPRGSTHALVALGIAALFGCSGAPSDADAPSGAGSSAEAPGRVVALVPEPVPSPVDVLVQAVHIPSPEVVWASGHSGTFLRSTDGGASWTAGVVEGHEFREFRDIHGFDADRAVLMAAGSGEASRIFTTIDGGGRWTERFVMDHPEGFLDCLAFWDDETGVAYGDAVEGGLYILRTTDGGASWSRVDPATLPPALEGEGGFAASGSCARTGEGGSGWIATGNGAEPRLLVTGDRGIGWEATPLPLAAGPNRGATTVDLAPDGMGFAMGGTIGAGEQGARVALTADHGLSWSERSDFPLEGAVYGAARMAGSPVLAAVGPGGIAVSADGGMRWTRVDSASHWAVEFGARTEAGWVGYATGPGGRITRLLPMRAADGGERIESNRTNQNPMHEEMNR